MSDFQLWAESISEQDAEDLKRKKCIRRSFIICTPCHLLLE
jgi:hypothetical protein